jgi:hypothetical protein
MNKNVNLTKNIIGDKEVYQLIISGLNKEQKEMIFLPKLQKINFLQISDQVITELKDETFENEFKNWIENLHKILIKIDSLDEILFEFQKGVKKHMLLFLTKKKPSLEKVRGLYGELLELRRALEKGNIERLEVLNGWHRPAPANHDFDYGNYSLEIKTLGRSKTRVRISSENQLNQFGDKQLILKVSVVDSVDKSSTDSLGELFNDIKSLLGLNLSIHFENKCSSDAYFSYFGPEHMPLAYKLFELESHFFNVDQDNFPRLTSQKIPTGISNTKYEIDLSSIQSFKIEKDPCPQN